MKNKQLHQQVAVLYFLGITISYLVIVNQAFSEVKRFKGQTVYVPIYSHIYHGDKENYPFYLTATLSIRNTDPDNPISITVVDYYDSDGKLLKNYNEKPLRINPMGAIRLIVKESDTSGGSGANFIVKWESDHRVVQPLIEAIMIGTKFQQGISFTSRGQIIREVE